MSTRRALHSRGSRLPSPSALGPWLFGRSSRERRAFRSGAHGVNEFALVENDDIAGVDQRSTDRADRIVRDPGHFTGRRPGGSLRDVLAGSTTGSRLSPRSCCSLGPGGPSPLSSAASIHALCLEYTNAAGIGADRHENFTRPRPDWRTSDESGERASGS